MHILYLDESGTHGSRHFIMAGLAIFERETYFLSRALDRLQGVYFPSHDEPINLHASDLRAPDERVRDPFSELESSQRLDLVFDIYQAIVDSRARLFGIAIEKAFVQNNQLQDLYERGFEEMVNRFDRMLARIGSEHGEPQRGLIVVAESSYRENIELLARNIASRGHRWGDTHNLADIPYFAPAGSTRLLQLADFVSNAVFRRYEFSDAKPLDVIISRFDREGDRIHGLRHFSSDYHNCFCPACYSRRIQQHQEND